jgi:drug/metabolite transporter (DMT)-like permease
MTGPMPASSNPARAIGSIVLATIFFVGMNTGVKVLSPHLPTVELIWVRTLGHLIFVVALFAPTHGGWRLLVTRQPGTQLTRSMLLLASTSLFFTALGFVPITEATAVSFTSPFIVAAVAGRVLHERVGVDHWVAIALGFIGALVVIRPGTEGANPYLALVLGSATCYAGYQVLTRRVASTDAPETSVVYSALLGTLILTAVVPFYWRIPTRPSHWLIVVSLGLLGGLGHYFVARALVCGAASIVAPFHYVQLIWAAVSGYLVFGDVPGGWTWLGAGIIVSSGLYVAWRGTRPATEPHSLIVAATPRTELRVIPAGPGPAR